MSVTETPRRAVGCTIVCVLSLVVANLLASHADAAMMIPGASLLASPEADPVGGTIVGTTANVPFSTANYTGTLTTNVISGDTSNPFGGLTFTYLLTNLAASNGEIDRLTVNGFAGLPVDASYQAPTVGLPPSLMSRSATGDVVGFTFVGAPIGAGVLTPGKTSSLLVVQTSAQFFGPGQASVIDGMVTSVGTLAPIPEPCTAALAGFGMMAVGFLRRRGRTPQRDV